MKKEHIYQGDVKFEDLKIGQQYLNVLTNTLSDVVQLTSSSVEMFNRTDRSIIDEHGHRKGVDCKNWYTIQQFNQKFKPLS